MNPKLRQQLHQVHALGARICAEFILELADNVAPARFQARLDLYSSMNPSLVSDLGADRWPNGLGGSGGRIP